MSKKKATTILLAAALVLGTLMLAGCSQQPAEEPAGEVAVESVEALEGEGEATADDSEQPAATEGQSSGSTSGGSAATTPSTGGSGSASGNSGSSGNTVAPSTPPAHEHSWTYHEAVYIENPVMEKRVVCSCGQLFTSTGDWDAHNKALGFGNTHSCSYKSVQVGTEKVLVSGEYWTCSCGATK